MYIYIYIYMVPPYMQACTYLPIYIYIYRYTYIHMSYLRTQPYVCTYLRTCIPTHTHTHTYTYTYTCTYRYTCSCTHTHIHIHRHKHRHTHRHKHRHTHTHTDTYTYTHAHMCTHPETHSHSHSHSRPPDSCWLKWETTLSRTMEPCLRPDCRELFASGFGARLYCGKEALIQSPCKAHVYVYIYICHIGTASLEEYLTWVGSISRIRALSGLMEC